MDVCREERIAKHFNFGQLKRHDLALERLEFIRVPYLGKAEAEILAFIVDLGKPDALRLAPALKPEDGTLHEVPERVVVQSVAGFGVVLADATAAHHAHAGHAHHPHLVRHRHLARGRVKAGIAALCRIKAVRISANTAAEIVADDDCDVALRVAGAAVDHVDFFDVILLRRIPTHGAGARHELGALALDALDKHGRGGGGVLGAALHQRDFLDSPGLFVQLKAVRNDQRRELGAHPIQVRDKVSLRFFHPVKVEMGFVRGDGGRVGQAKAIGERIVFLFVVGSGLAFQFLGAVSPCRPGGVELEPAVAQQAESRHNDNNQVNVPLDRVGVDVDFASHGLQFYGVTQHQVQAEHVGLEPGLALVALVVLDVRQFLLL